ncbi:MAG: helix-turn-helix domain-containing protein [bacterium]|nr:helix-turn-helix domain-containing protein [bacterium]
MTDRPDLPEFPPILTLEQAARLLQVSTRTIQRMVKDGRLPGRQVGSQWRFDREQIRAWVRGEHDPESAAVAQRELIERERARLGVDMPETLIDMQQEAVRRHAARHHRDED